MKYNPIPFDKRLLESALDMKQSGLPWTPETGCFVWDPEAVIQAPSPFPNRVYFILNMRRFLDIFGDVEAMKEKLVWLPTGCQAAQLCRELHVNRSAAVPFPVPDGDELVRLYRVIAKKVDKVGNLAAHAGQTPGEESENQWLAEVIHTDMGGVEEFPPLVQRWIRFTYETVASAYLGWRRIQEQQNDDWLPPERSLDPGLLSELGHFYSDYQHQIRSLETIRRTVHLLRSVDPETAPHTHNQLLQVLNDGASNKHWSNEIMEALTTPIETQAIS